MSRPRWSQPTRWPGLVRGATSLVRRTGRLSDLTSESEAMLAHTQPATDQVRGVISTHGQRISEALGDPVAGRMFTRLMLNTWQTTMTRRPDGTTFVITGDIPAMWLRDSSAQLRPFVLLAPESEDMVEAILGVVRQQWQCIERAPYANAFNPEPNNASWHPGDLCDNPWVWEEKYEVDSLAFPIQLAWQVWKATGLDAAIEPVRHRARIVVDLWRREQDHAAGSSYRFVRPRSGDTLGKDGRGTPVARTGMTWSGFRPSDDPCALGYNIPAQLFAAHALDLLAEMAQHWRDADLVAGCTALAADIRQGVKAHGFAAGLEAGTGPVLAYEVDGLGGQVMMDDANMPSLLSLPLCSAVAADDPVYRATRRWVLSQRNPHYHLGTAASGVGSPHTPQGHIWPIGLAVQGLTSNCPATKRRMAEVLMRTDGGTGMMHESFHADDAGTFTRPWFSWANSMFCELLLDLAGVTMTDLTGDWHDDW
ncbi:glycoside hydrolase family 125 protein [Tessaracoccus sp. SD287]|uniref:glycoside hydrolase family 125 protein n=1 Tax=Tessaracoccus sp. SD287 TaxID=2782008 RepID=UPI001F607898|nr:glycoside hydrolase family 125 protein [Tessaracoccus sp. SD287]